MLCADIFFGAYLLEVLYIEVGVSVSCIPHAFIAGAARCILACLPESSAFLLSLSLSLSLFRGEGQVAYLCTKKKNYECPRANYADLMPVFWGMCNVRWEFFLPGIFIKFWPSFVPQTSRMGRETEKIGLSELLQSSFV